jgi:hypothetical protein
VSKATLETPAAVRVPSVHSKGGRNAAIVALVILGVALIGLATGLWLANGSPSKSTITKHDTTIVSKAPVRGSAPGSPNHAQKRTQTTVNSSETTSGGGPSRRSETLVITLLALGSLLFLCGVFFGRIQEVTLPGGAGLKLSEAVQAKVAAKVASEAKANPKLGDDPATIARLYQMTLDHLGTLYPESAIAQSSTGYYVAGGTPLVTDIPDKKVTDAVSLAAEKLTSPES